MLDTSIENARALDGEVILPGDSLADVTSPSSLPLKTLACALQRALEGLLPVPRLLTRAQAARYCGLSESAFDDWQRRRLLPRPIECTKRWDRRAIDLALDRASGLTPEDYRSASSSEVQASPMSRPSGTITTQPATNAWTSAIQRVRSRDR